MPQPWTSSASASLEGGIVTLVEGSSFAISLPSGDMLPGHPHGVFFRDTRFLSEFRLRVNDEWPEPLAAQTLDPFSAAFVLRAAPPAGRADSHLVVFRNRFVGRGMREDVTIHNYGEEPAFCAVEIQFDCDFADLFEVKESRVQKVGELTVSSGGSTAAFSYTRSTFHRGARLDFSQRPALADRVATFETIVLPRAEWSLCVQLTPLIDDQPVQPRYACGVPVEHATPNERLLAWRANLPTLTTDHDSFQHLLGRSTEDLAALRLFDPEQPDRTVVAAGAPWFMTLFGRDSLITSWMAMMVDSDLALGTLQTLAELQGRDVDPITEEEPGRILHEMRFGESARLSLGGRNVYYGTVDATPLFVMVLGELQRWGNRREEVDALLPAADRALAWIDDFGDRDGDGYVEYQRPSDRGLQNQGWKDSWDAVHFSDGRLAQAPIALCEVQGYVHAALLARAHFAIEAGDHTLAMQLRDRAADLKARFNRDFWLEDRGWFAIGLDRDKRPIDALVSNMGHCLWTGIVDDEKAPVVAQRLLSEELFSGWGIRTLATSMTRYNPISYHNGSVWPHDNALCAAGLVRYGMLEEAHRVMEGIVRTGEYYGNRLPELFAGFPAAGFGFPIGYPTSCSPQAWAAAAPLLFLRSLLRFEPDIRRGRLHLAPAIPDWLGRFRLDGVPIMGGRLSLEADGERVESISVPDDLRIVSAPLYHDGGTRE
jgi:glycogen debranching enzyme